MEKNEEIIRREQRKIKSSKKERAFSLGIIRKEIFQFQNGKNIGIFRYKLLTKRGDFDE